jgi:hypothetical protein
VSSYRELGNFAALHAGLEALFEESDLDDLIAAVEPFLDIPEVAGPVYERVVAVRPDDSRALVVLASAYWLTGRGPDVAGELASRALSADPSNRGAWHLWAITESEPRLRMDRWLQVTRRFPADELARANLADGAASVASAENDPVALSIAIEAFEALLQLQDDTGTGGGVGGGGGGLPEQRAAVEKALQTLRGWRL